MTKNGVPEENVPLQAASSPADSSGPPAPVRGPPPEKPLRERLRVDPRLFSVKILVFMVYGGSAAILPFVTVHMKSLGISVTEIAVIMLLVPILSSIGPTLAGALADRLGNYKIVLVSFTLVSTFLHACMWFFVPAYGSHTIITMGNHPLSSDFVMHLPCNNDYVHFDYTGVRAPQGFLPNNASIRPQILFYKCSTNCAKLSVDAVCLFDSRNVSNLRCQPLIGEHVLVLNDAIDDLSNTTFQMKNTKSRCYNQFPAWNVTVTDCSITCKIELQNHTITTQIPYGDRVTTLALYLTFRFLSMTAFRGINPILDAAVLEYSKQHGADFGIQRLFASVGSVVIPPLSGWLTGLASTHCACPDYGPAFYLFAGMNLMAAVLICKMDIKVKQPQTQILRTMGIVLRNPNVTAFLVVVFFCGCGWGIILNYMFLFMEDDRDFQFSAPAWMLGLVNTVGYALGIPILFFSTQLIKKVGHENLLAIGILCYAGRFLAYSFTYNPWLIYPTEALTAWTFLVFVLAPQYALKTAPKYLATLVGLFGAANFGLGGGAGPLIAGLLIHYLGYRPAFRILALLLGVVGGVYLLVYHFVLKKKWQVITERTNSPTERTKSENQYKELDRKITDVGVGILSTSSMSISEPVTNASEPTERATEHSTNAFRRKISTLH
ncbi:uncharacterized protein LOC129601438 [Paramacrobiotus metropolitanus]|uniref:uncharacterized protein LOC129601438 n=1 Tax=Paramacrobiotus metropolitanus TaxID=2943436 RepID=UPI0024457AA2|nr:uncharacterized protein LOC129601438 [Paramacrobiotus metropolitanus]